MNSILSILTFALVVSTTFSVTGAEDVCVKALGLVLDEDSGTCVSLCDESSGKIFNPKKGKCRKLCKKKQGLEFNKKKKECRSICGRVRLFDKDTKECYCAGTNTKYQKKKDKCKCQKGFYEIKPDPDGNFRTLECTLAVPTSAPVAVVPDIDTAAPTVGPTAVPTVEPTTGSPSATPSIAPSGVIPVQTTQSVNFTIQGDFSEELTMDQAAEIGELLCDGAMMDNPDILNCAADDIEVVSGRRRLSEDGRSLQGGFVAFNAIMLFILASTLLINNGVMRNDVTSGASNVAEVVNMGSTISRVTRSMSFMASLTTSTVTGSFFMSSTVAFSFQTTTTVETVEENSEEPSAAPSEMPITPTGSPVMSLVF